MKRQECPKESELNGLHKVLSYVGDVNLLRDNMNATKNNTFSYRSVNKSISYTETCKRFPLI
jgi:hypothetical protein